MSADVYGYLHEKKRDRRQFFRMSRKNKLSKEDALLLATMEKLQSDLAASHNFLDTVTDPDLIDSYIYEINALNMRYKFYLQECKARGLVSAIF